MKNLPSSLIERSNIHGKDNYVCEERDETDIKIPTLESSTTLKTNYRKRKEIYKGYKKKGKEKATTPNSRLL